ncbi:MAG: hypothetical protein ABIA37_02530 [Candidatus Woesearchaeota archaeon]
MLEPLDIGQAKKLFKEWDLRHAWHSPTPEFIEHCKKKARESLDLAGYLLEKIENTSELENNDAVTLWIITQSYYSMFFEVEYLLSLGGRKLPEGTKDTHKTVYLAFIYYYLIKCSELEQKKPVEMTTSRMSRALAIFKELQDETMELQRVAKSAEDLKRQKDKRHLFTYKMSRSAEISEAKTSLEKAKEFRELIEEYILTRK